MDLVIRAVVLFFFISRSPCHCVADVFFAPVGAGVVALAVVIVLVLCYAIGGIYLAMGSGWLGEELYWRFAAPPLEDDHGN